MYLSWELVQLQLSALAMGLDDPAHEPGIIWRPENSGAKSRSFCTHPGCLKTFHETITGDASEGVQYGQC